MSYDGSCNIQSDVSPNEKYGFHMTSDCSPWNSLLGGRCFFSASFCSSRDFQLGDTGIFCECGTLRAKPKEESYYLISFKVQQSHAGNIPLAFFRDPSHEKHRETYEKTIFLSFPFRPIRPIRRNSYFALLFFRFVCICTLSIHSLALASRQQKVSFFEPCAEKKNT